jgi:hypothetical protein
MATAQPPPRNAPALALSRPFGTKTEICREGKHYSVIAGAEQGALANHIMIVLVIMHRVVRALCQSLVLAVLYEADVQRSLYTLASHLCDIVLNPSAKTPFYGLDGAPLSRRRLFCPRCLFCLPVLPAGLPSFAMA